ncbi:MAG: hypothetical protein ABIY50_03435 [Ignavibacteria bacterium]
MSLIKERLSNAFILTNELLESIAESNLKLKIPNVPSNTIGGQYWCVIRARQSYIKTIENGGEWMGFTCDLKNPHSKEEIEKLLKSTFKDLEHLKLDEKNEKVLIKLVELFEHEIQHHGQLIRFIYANKLKFPESWKKKYTV